MEKRTFWPFSVKNFPQDMNIPVEKCEVDPNIMKAIYEYFFYGKPKEDPIPHLKKFNERCKMLNLYHASVKIKLFSLLPRWKSLRLDIKMATWKF